VLKRRGAKDEVLDHLSHLVDKSLVVADQKSREMRYRMLETIRAYSLERLIDSGEIGEIQRRHLNWFATLAEQAEPELQGRNQGDWLERLVRENDNFRAALAWSLEGDTRMALRLAGSLGQFWFMRGHHFGEGKDWLEKALARSGKSEHVALRAKALQWLGNVAYYHGDYALARSVFENGLSLYQKLDDKDGVAQCSYFLADVAARQGDAEAPIFYAMARSFSEESLAGLREQGDQWKIARTLNLLGEMERVEGHYLTARTYYEESLTVRRELGDQRGMAVSLINLGHCAHHQGDYKQAVNIFEESLALFQQLGSPRGIIDCLAALAGVAVAEKKLERAARLFGAAEALHESIHAGLAAEYPDRIEYDRSIAVVRSQLSEDAFAAAWLKGRAMTLEQAVDYAFSAYEVPISDFSLKEKFGGLTAREREAAALIAQGKSNREIAEAMVVGVRMVETYVTRILNKLGFDSRVQIATWVIEKGLSIQRKTR
jgi:DNA-binding CsgD family transcriptional regulator